MQNFELCSYIDTYVLILNASKYNNEPLYLIVFLLLFKNNDKKKTKQKTKNKKLGYYKEGEILWRYEKKKNLIIKMMAN